MGFDEYLKRSLLQLNIDILDEQTEQFRKYYELLLVWNSFMNLTAITEEKDVIDKHFVDSILACRYFDHPENEVDHTKGKDHVLSVIDIGAGAGFPSVPLKILFPDLRLTLVDSLNKRVKFLNELISVLKLKEVSSVHARAESLARDESHRQKYDLCLSRAVANLSTLSELCLPFVRCGGLFISYKSADSKAEIEESEKAINVLGGRIRSIEQSVIPYTDIQRSFVIIEKEKNTPKKYPRREGIPSKDPIR